MNSQSHLRTLARSAVTLGMLQAASMVLAFLVGILLARQLGPSGYGVYALAMSVATLVGILTEFGLPALALREVAAARSTGQWGMVHGLMRWADRVIIGISAAVLACFFVVALLFDFTSRSAFLGTMVWAILLVPIAGMAKLRSYALLSLGRTFAGQFAVLVVRPGMFALALAVFWVAGRKLAPASAMSWQVAAATATLLVVALLYHRFRPADLLRAKPLNLWRQWLSTSVPMGMTEGLRLLQSQMATYMLSLLSTTAVIGLFRVADSASALCLVPITIMNVVASPYFARLHAADDKAELQKITTAVSVTIFAGVAATAIPLSIFARPLLILAFGPEFAGSTDAFRIMLIANLLVTILGPTVSLANMTGLERYVTGATGLAALANAASAVLLIPLFGAAGGAISVAVGLFAWNGTLALVLRRHIGIDPTIFAINRSSFAAVFREARRLTLMPGPRRRDD